MLELAMITTRCHKPPAIRIQFRHDFTYFHVAEISN
jgi:hypothetical protein